MQSALDRTGSIASGPLVAALSLARAWAGPACEALLLSGSHASGEAVWIEWEGRSVSLSDLDLYAVMPESRECRAAERRARAARPGLASRLLGLGIASPLEVGFLTARDLQRLPARPGTLELARHARVVAGDPAWLSRLPSYAPRDVPAEETLLLLENRGFELLAAQARIEGAPLDRWRARHAVLKCALDLAGVVALAHREYPDGAEARVAWMRQHDPVPDPGLATLCATALAWRRAPSPWDSPGAARDEWHSVVRAWTTVWDRLGRARLPGEPDPVRRAMALAARARVPRRVRQALRFETRGGPGPGAWRRWSHALRGTPQHRLNASATVLLLAAAESAEPPALDSKTRAALDRLGAVSLPRGADFGVAAAEAVRLWDRWILDGQRSAEGD